VHSENVPPCTADRLREVEVLFESGESVHEDKGRMRACSSGEIEDAEKLFAVARNPSERDH
jgi:hypothetical protein